MYMYMYVYAHCICTCTMYICLNTVHVHVHCISTFFSQVVFALGLMHSAEPELKIHGNHVSACTAYMYMYMYIYRCACSLYFSLIFMILALQHLKLKLPELVRSYSGLNLQCTVCILYMCTVHVY